MQLSLEPSGNPEGPVGIEFVLIGQCLLGRRAYSASGSAGFYKTGLRAWDFVGPS